MISKPLTGIQDRIIEDESIKFIFRFFHPTLKTNFFFFIFFNSFQDVMNNVISFRFNQLESALTSWLRVCH